MQAGPSYSTSHDISENTVNVVMFKEKGPVKMTGPFSFRLVLLSGITHQVDQPIYNITHYLGLLGHAVADRRAFFGA